MSEGQLQNIMQGVDVERCFNPEIPWAGRMIYRGTKEALIATGVASEFMFATPPKKVTSFWLDCNGELITDDPHDREKYDRRGKSKARHCSSHRIKGGLYKLDIDMSWEQWTKICAESKQFKTEGQYVSAIMPLIERYVNWIKHAASGNLVDNVNDYYLSNSEEIMELADRLLIAAQESQSLKYKPLRPFTVIDGGIKLRHEKNTPNGTRKKAADSLA